MIKASQYGVFPGLKKLLRTLRYITYLYSLDRPSLGNTLDLHKEYEELREKKN